MPTTIKKLVNDSDERATAHRLSSILKTRSSCSPASIKIHELLTRREINHAEDEDLKNDKSRAPAWWQKALSRVTPIR